MWADTHTFLLSALLESSLLPCVNSKGPSSPQPHPNPTLLCCSAWQFHPPPFPKISPADFGSTAFSKISSAAKPRSSPFCPCGDNGDSKRPQAHPWRSPQSAEEKVGQRKPPPPSALGVQSWARGTALGGQSLGRVHRGAGEGSA